LGELELAILAFAALATSALTAVVGLGGGIILLSLMLLFYEPLVAIPLHGAVQLVSNGSRAVVQRQYVQWRLLGPYAVPLLPAGAVGVQVVQALPAALLRGAIGAFVLLAVWAPRALLLGVHPERVPPARRFLALGVVIGFLNTTVGATGPLQGPFYSDLGLSRHQIVGTFAAAQTLGHAIKIALFAAVGFAFADHAVAFALLAAGVTAGTLLGSRLLERVSEARFRVLYRVVLSLVALRLLLDALL
jgi:uncharacterized membrane protein YfcA